jgi:hypothetical protein
VGLHAGRPIREAIIHHSSDGVFSVRQGRWKLILDTEGSGGWPPPRGGGPVPGRPGQLYDLADDPSEQMNLWGKREDIVRQLKGLLERYQEQGRSPKHRKQDKDYGSAKKRLSVDLR